MCRDPKCNLPGFIDCPADDVELVALLEKVVALNAEADVAKQAAALIWPEIERLAKGDPLWRSSKLQRHKAASDFAYSSGWEALVTLENDKLEEADEIVKLGLTTYCRPCRDSPHASASSRRAISVPQSLSPSSPCQSSP
jgi:hypothetical protein